MRILFWNTFLLRVRLGPVVVHRKPRLEQRAQAIGEVLRGTYDVVALAEVFDQSERDVIGRGWGGVAVGPTRRGGKSSGLVTLSERPPVRTVRYRYRAIGNRLRDSDAWAAKGVLLTEVVLAEGRPNLEVYSTHMFHGGDLLLRVRDADAVRFAQVEELLAMVEAEHRPGNVALVCGDFNIADTARLAQRMAEAGFVDLWRGGPGGQTCDLMSPEGPTERIDYMFLRSSPVVATALDLVAPQDSDGYLSDHAGLELTLTVAG